MSKNPKSGDSVVPPLPTVKAEAEPDKKKRSVRKEQTPLPPEIVELVLRQRGVAERIFWILAGACLVALIVFDVVVLPFYWPTASPAIIGTINAALGGSSGLLAFIGARIFRVYERI